MLHSSSTCRVVSRPGVVVDVRESVADVQIVQSSTCGACAVKAICSSTESATRIVTARCPEPVACGANVELSMDERWGILATVLVFCVPLILVVVSFFATKGLGAGDSLAGIAAIAVLGPYIFLLYRMRAMFARVISFTARPLVKEGA